MKTLKVILSLIAIVLVVILFQVINKTPSSDNSTQSSRAPEPDRPKFGEKGYLQGGGHAVPVALTEDDLEAWTKAQAANDDHGQKSLMIRSKIFAVDNGTKIPSSIRRCSNARSGSWKEKKKGWPGG